MHSLIEKPRLLWITRSALFVALLLVVQFSTGAIAMPTGQFVTGSLVNLILIIAVLTGGLSTGIVVAVFSPILAKLIGIGPMWEIIPFIILGNFELVVLWHLLATSRHLNKQVARIIALVVAAVGKFIVLYLGIVMLALPIILHLSEPQATVISTMFTWPQLITALIGGILAILTMPAIEKALVSVITKSIVAEQQPVDVQKLKREINKEVSKKKIKKLKEFSYQAHSKAPKLARSKAQKSYKGKYS